MGILRTDEVLRKIRSLTKAVDILSNVLEEQQKAGEPLDIATLSRYSNKVLELARYRTMYADMQIGGILNG